MSGSSENVPPVGAVPPPPPPPAPPTPVQSVIRRPRRSPWASFAIGCGVLVLLALVLMLVWPLVTVFTGRNNLDFGRTGNVAVIDVTGQIHFGTGGSGLFREAGASEDIIEQVRSAAEDSKIKAVVLNINSPGGTPAASQAIAQEVRRLGAKKPVVAAMGDVAASGAYYVASQAKKIVANPSTLTGSIGVRMEVMYFYELMQRYGVASEQITSGPFKDMGSPFRPMRPDERAVIQGIIQDTYDQFVSDVAKGRKAAGVDLDVPKVRKLADGRVYTGNQALKVGLVDQLGDMHDAVTLAAELAEIKGKPSIRHLGRLRGWEALFSSVARLLPGSRFPAGYWPASWPHDLSRTGPVPELR